MATTDELADRIRSSVDRALGGDDPTADLNDIARDAFSAALADTGSDDPGNTDTFVASLGDAFDLLEPDGSDEQVDRMARIIAHAAVNAATLASGPPDVEWRTMRDDAVRDLHRPLDGEVRAAGEPFDVGGSPLLYPGQPVGPPEGWINCRCLLVPAAVAAAGDPAPVAAAISEEPWSEWTAADYTVPQWHRACLIHLHNGAPTGKGQCKLPVRTPTGTVNRAGVHAAAAALAGARGGVDAPAEQKAKARAALRGLYRQLDEEPPDSLAADGGVVAADRVSPPGTHDAPGWLTHPRETQRLRTYWTKGEGAAKIRWGQRGDFDRCRRQLRKYVTNPEFLDGTCANLHKVALGFWPGQGPHASAEPTTPEGIAVTAAFTAAADIDDALPPLEWFTDPGFTGPTPLTVLDDGHVYGHGALFGECHLGYEDRCVEAPHSDRSYAYFRTGAVETAGGTVSVGQITMDTGHAPEGDAHRAAVAHYDDTGTVVADVAAGEDEWGVWLNGQLRPGLDPAKVRALQAAAISGDWRRVGGQLEFVAALAVNVPGFPVPRPQLVASAAGEPWSMVAVGVVEVDPNAAEIDRIAIAVVDRLDERERRAANAQRVAALNASIKAVRVSQLTAAIEGAS